METKLVKGGLYGFIIGLFVAILFCADRMTVHVSASSTTMELLTMREYVLKLLRYSCGFSLGTVAVLWLQDWMKRDPRDKQEPSFVVGFLKAFFIVLGGIIALTVLMICPHGTYDIVETFHLKKCRFVVHKMSYFVHFNRPLLL